MSVADQSNEGVRRLIKGKRKAGLNSQKRQRVVEIWLTQWKCTKTMNIQYIVKQKNVLRCGQETIYNTGFQWLWEHF